MGGKRADVVEHGEDLFRIQLTEGDLIADVTLLRRSAEFRERSWRDAAVSLSPLERPGNRAGVDAHSCLDAVD
jgi:hypothetical protein